MPKINYKFNKIQTKFYFLNVRGIKSYLNKISMLKNNIFIKIKF